MDLEAIYLLVNDKQKFLMHLRDLSLLIKETRCSLNLQKFNDIIK